MSLILKSLIDIAGIVKIFNHDEGTFELGEDGLRIQSIDTNRSVMFELYIDKEDLGEDYRINPSRFGVNLIDFRKVLEKCKSENDFVSLTYERPHLIFKVRSTTRNKILKLPVIDPKDENKIISQLEQVYDELNSTAHMLVPLEKLKEVAEDAKLFSDALTMKTDGGNLIFESDGSGELYYECPIDIIGIDFIDLPETPYSLKHIEMISKFEKFLFSMEFRPHPDTGLLRIDYKLGLEHGSYLKAYISCRSPPLGE